jgi:hypothetical protein
MEALPDDIRNLPKYKIPGELFICTGVLLAFFAVWGIIMFIVWLWRSRKHIHNY